ncbi:hypothetical protein ACIBKX_37335 [Streptomyces sp. NPDC050658]|uniref:hypothetical protein n=1 Tax=unclassified Streptomyces TaxID=2593676 RepID=UPI003444FB8A
MKERTELTMELNFHAKRSIGSIELRDSPLQSHFNARYVNMAPHHRNDTHELIKGLKSSLWALVPMAEWQPEMAPTVEQAASYISQYVTTRRALFVDGGSCLEAVKAARRGGATVISQDDVLDAVDWKRLLPILNLDERPRGRAGQGLNVLAGHISLIALGLAANDIVFQCDADVRNYRELAPLERLIGAWWDQKGIHHVKLSQPGRNNESLMIVRTLQRLWNALDLDWIPESVKDLGEDIFMALGPDKWLTCGIYLSRGQVVQARPGATGYLDATLQALWTINAPECGWRKVRHVEAEPPCQDVQNSPTKEFTVLTNISTFIHTVALLGKPPHSWNLAEIEALNTRIMPQLDHVPIVSGEGRPVSVHHINTERIIPSPGYLITRDLLDLDRVRKVAMRAIEDGCLK